MIDEERASELRETKRELYKKIRELVDRKNIIELQLGDLRNRYQVADRELAEMNVTIIKLSEKKPAPKPTLTVDQVRDLAKRLGIEIEEDWD